MAAERYGHRLNTLGSWCVVLIQLASDLHLERLENEGRRTRIIEPAPGASMLILAGDIHNGTRGVECFADWPVPVIYLAGNHEFYDHEWERTRGDLRTACAGTQVTLLDNDVVELPGVRILGCTLWTDFTLRGATQAHSMSVIENGLNDYYVIRTEQGPLRARHTLADHESSRAWLESELARSFDGRTVVATHHGPHPLSIHRRFVGNPINPGFVSDLTPLMHDVDLWVHGHTHDSFDYRVGRCRVVANPAGYVLTRRGDESDSELEFENRCFDKQLVIDVPA